MLGKPVQYALGLKEIPSYYRFPDSIEVNRGAFIESLYEAINEIGLELSDDAQEEIVQETILAFKLNAAVYSEFPRPLVAYATLGAVNIAVGFFQQRLGLSTSLYWCDEEIIAIAANLCL